MTTINWQQPFVNTFKHFTIASDRNVVKHGDISTVMDIQIKSNVFRILGTTATSSFINMPKLSGQSLGLTGRYIYIFFKPQPNKCFSLHLDLNTDEKTTIRISFSNLFKEFKATATWVQFPFMINAPRGSVYERAEQTAKDLSGPAPPITKWTVFCVDLANVTKMYANRTYNCLRGYKLCANIQIKNVVTSDLLYEVGVSHPEARMRGSSALPRELAYPCEKHDNWHNLYDYVSFPNEGFLRGFETSGQSRVVMDFGELGRNFNTGNNLENKISKKVFKNKSSSASMVQQHMSNENESNRSRKFSDKFKNGETGVFRLPLVGVSESTDNFISPDEARIQNQTDIHVYPFKSGHVALNSPRTTELVDFLPDEVIDNLSKIDLKNSPNNNNQTKVKSCLQPDPILRIKKLIGFGAKQPKNVNSFTNLIWSIDSQYIVYSCQAVVVVYHVNTSDQWCFVGHADKVSCIAMNTTNTIIASGQTGQFSLVRLWDFHSQQCIAIFRNHDHSLHLLEFSSCGNYLCGVGKDKQGKTMLVIWDLREIKFSSNTDSQLVNNCVRVVAKAHTDVHITKCLFVHYDSTRLITCGRENIRFWRLKDDTLRSCAVNLSPYIQALNMNNFQDIDQQQEKLNYVPPKIFLEFTDICMNSTSQINDNSVYACTRTGQIFEFNIATMEIENVRVLEPMIKKKKGILTNRQTPIPAALRLNTLSVSDTFCTTGSDDGFVRIWPLDFSQVSVEAEHESAISMCRFSPDFIRIATVTDNGNLGILDVKQKEYITLVRSHTDIIVDAAFDPACKYIATASSDATVRVWDFVSSRQLYDYSAADEVPTKLAFHPVELEHGDKSYGAVFACGFSSGTIRVFNVKEARLLREITAAQQNRSSSGGKMEICDLKYANEGRRLVVADLMRYICLYDVDREYGLLRMLPGCVAVPGSLAMSFDDKNFAVIGATNYLITIFESASLNELLRIDITSPTNTSHVSINHSNHYDLKPTNSPESACIKLAYAPNDMNQLLCVTAANKLLKFDLKTGRQVGSVARIHKNHTDSLAVTSDGRYLVTSGDNIIKIWDYEMRLEKNFQAFIGHSAPVNCILFTPDHSQIVSVGDSIIYWDFLAYSANEDNNSLGRPKEMPKGRVLENMRDLPVAIIRENKQAQSSTKSNQKAYNQKGQKSKITKSKDALKYTTDINQFKILNLNQFEEMKAVKQKPTLVSKSLSSLKGVDTKQISKETIELKHFSARNSPIHWDSNVSFEKPRTPPIAAQIKIETIAVNGEIEDTFLNDDFTFLESNNSSLSSNQVPKKFLNLPNFIFENDETVTSKQSKNEKQTHLKKHTRIREKNSVCAKRRYLAPTDKCGLKLNSMIGYNGRWANKNMVWSPEREFFGFTCGTIVCVEDLKTGKQTLLSGEHQEDVTVLALKSDCSQMASGSAYLGKLNQKITIWDCIKHRPFTTFYHKHASVLTCLSFSPDDCLLISIGNYLAPSLTIWQTQSYSPLVIMDSINHFINDIAWNPSKCNEFTMCGENKTLIIWTFDEKRAGERHSLRSFECDTPFEICDQIDDFAYTSLAYSEESLVYVGTSFGLVTVWNTKKKTCFLNWHADVNEVSSLVSIGKNIVSGSVEGDLKLWNCQYVNEIQDFQNKSTHKLDGLIIENEISLNGGVKCCTFDKACEVGIVACESGTLWYVNWKESTSVRLMSTHGDKINSVQWVSDKYLATASDDGALCIWSVEDRERIVQFDVKAAATCQTLIEKTSDNLKCLGSFFKQNDFEGSPLIVAGYADGTVRVFNIDAKRIVNKIKCMNDQITVVNYCRNTSILIVGSVKGLLAIIDLNSGGTTRLIHDHNGAPITSLDSVYCIDKKLTYWLAVSHDRRLSIWNSKWHEDLFQMIDWLTFTMPNGQNNIWNTYKKCVAQFANGKSQLNTVIVSNGFKQELLFYNFDKKQIVRTMSLSEWPECLSLTLKGNLMAYGTGSRLLQLKDCDKENFQDYAEHSDSVIATGFSKDGKKLVSTAFNEILIWDVNV